MLMGLVAAMGAVNFYCHRAVMEGEGPVFAEIAAAIRRVAGRWGGYVLEFAILLVALWFARAGKPVAGLVYGVYTVLNLTGYLMLKRMGGR